MTGQVSFQKKESILPPLLVQNKRDPQSRWQINLMHQPRRLLSKKPLNLAALALIAYSLILGYNWVIMKSALTASSPLAFAAMRAVLGSLALWILLIGSRKSRFRPERWKGVILVGLLQTTAVIGLVFLALQMGSAGRTAVLMYTMPFWAALLGWLILDERLTVGQWLAIAIGFIGIVLIFTPWEPSGAWLGKILAILAGLANAGSMITLKKMRQGGSFNILNLTAWQTTIGSLPLIALACFTPGQFVHWTPDLIGALVYNAVLATAAAWLLWTWLSQRMPAGSLGMSTLSIPVIGLVASVLQLHEKLTLWEGIGMFLILLGLAYQFSQRRGQAGK